MNIPSTLVSKRICLRPYQAGEGVALYDAVNEDRAHLRQWLPWADEHVSPAASEEAVRRFQHRWAQREEWIVGIWERKAMRLLGGSGLNRINWDVPSFEIGYWLRPSAQGQGYATETVALLCRMAFGTLSAQRIVIRCDKGNDRSVAVPSRLGFVEEAVIAEERVFVLTPDDYAWGPQ